MEKILIVDDNKYLRFALSSLLEDSGFKAIAIGDPLKAVQEIEKKKPAAVILDKKMPGYDGIQLLKDIKNLDKNLPVIMLTAYGDSKAEAEAFKLGVYAFLSKPFDNDEIISHVRKSIKNKAK